MATRKNVNACSLAEIIDLILEKGIVIDAFVRVAVAGIEVLAIEVRVVIITH